MEKPRGAVIGSGTIGEVLAYRAIFLQAGPGRVWVLSREEFHSCKTPPWCSIRHRRDYSGNPLSREATNSLAKGAVQWSESRASSSSFS